MLAVDYCGSPSEQVDTWAKNDTECQQVLSAVDAKHQALTEQLSQDHEQTSQAFNSIQQDVTQAIGLNDDCTTHSADLISESTVARKQLEDFSCALSEAREQVCGELWEYVSEVCSRGRRRSKTLPSTRLWLQQPRLLSRVCANFSLRLQSHLIWLVHSQLLKSLSKQWRYPNRRYCCSGFKRCHCRAQCSRLSSHTVIQSHKPTVTALRCGIVSMRMQLQPVRHCNRRCCSIWIWLDVPLNVMCRSRIQLARPKERYRKALHLSSSSAHHWSSFTSHSKLM